MESVLIRVFNSEDQDEIDYAEGHLTGLGYSVERVSGVEGLDIIDNTKAPSSESHFDDVVVLIATQ